MSEDGSHQAAQAIGQQVSNGRNSLMSTELTTDHMNGSTPRHIEYLAAVTSMGSHMTVVTLDPADPWAGFETMRRHMQAQPTGEAEFDLLETKRALGRMATVIDLTSRCAG